MMVNNNRLLANLAGFVSLAGISLFVTLPSSAKEVLNPNPSIFSESPYNHTQRVQINSGTNVVDNTKGQKKKQVTQNSGSGEGFRPSIFNEPPYNRSGRTTPVNIPPKTPAITAPTSTTGSQNLLALVESDQKFSTLSKALKAAGLTDALQGKDSITIFAPTNAAFDKLPQDALKALLQPENKEVLVKVLSYHVVPGKVLSSDLKSGEVKSAEGGAINVRVDNQGVRVNDAKVIQANIQGSNGVIHVIDTVIVPPDL